MDASLYVAISSVLAAAISAMVIVKGQKTSAEVSTRANSNAEVQTIFDGYSQIVEELRIEVERLMTTIAILQHEQAACEERNNALIREVDELKHRLHQLECRDERK